LRMICETGENTPALRAENVDMYLDTAQFLKVEDTKGQSIVEEGEEDGIDAAEEDEDIDEVTALDAADEEEEE
jgi:hypothetical protein